MKRTVLLAAWALMALQVVGTPAVAQAPDVGLTLAGKNVLKGKKSFTRQVIIPAPVTIDDDILHNKDVKISGDGRIVGFSLVEAGPIPKPEELNALQMRFCSYRGCASGKTNTFFGMAGDTRLDDPAPRPLRPGRYFLTFLADGGPAKVTFKLRGLSGTATFKDGDPVRQQIVKAQREFMSPNGNLYAAGQIQKVPENGVTLMALQTQSEHTAGGLSGACLDRELVGPPPPPEQEYAPSCFFRQEGAAALSENRRVPPGPGRSVIAHWATADKAKASHGMWAKSAGADLDVRPMAFWFPYPEAINRTTASSIMMQWDSR